MKGFTLVELAIVLVIIGLIIAGVLVGQDMIKAATLRATIGQVEKYKTAVNTFRSKYNCLPGDCTAAANFGMQARSNADGHGDGDGYIEACTPTTSFSYQGCESTLFWRDLSFAGLIPDSIITATDAYAAVTTANLPKYFPKAKISETAYFVVFNSVNSPETWIRSYANYLAILSMTDVDVTGLVDGLAAPITPVDASNIDTKMDDGKPLTGAVLSGINQTFSFIVGGPWVDACATAAATYNTADPTYANSALCVMNFKM